MTTPDNDRVSDEKLTFHVDPFFAECRAYGKIEEYRKCVRSKPLGRAERFQRRDQTQTNDEIAVPCYGYTYLPAMPYEDIIENKFGIKSWNRSTEDSQRLPSQKEPFRAIVKQFVDSKKSVVNPAKMLRDLKKLRSLGVFQRDVCDRNYKDGLLVDFSVAWTEPFWRMKLMGEIPLRIMLEDELFQFDEMIQTSGIKTTVRAMPNLSYRKKLRRPKKVTPNKDDHDTDEDDTESE